MKIDVEQTIEELRTLSVDQRIRVVSALWDSIVEEGSPPPFTPEQRAEIDRRLDDLERNPDDLLSWDEVLQQVRAEP